MTIRVLGSSGAEVPGYGLSGFLVDDSMLLDVGSVTQSLSLPEQKHIKDILITHSHLDHIKDLAFLADNLILDNHLNTINVYALKETIEAIKTHILNDVIWPDFTRIPSETKPVLRFIPIEPLKQLQIGQYRILPLPVDHSVAAVGYLVQDETGAFAYTGDTGPAEALWKALKGVKLNVLIVEVSFPDEMRHMAIKTGHLCPSLLKAQIDNHGISCERIFITHIKPQYEDSINEQLKKLQGYTIEVLDSPRIIDLP